MLASTAVPGVCRQIAIIVTLMMVGCSDMDTSPVEPNTMDDPANLPSLMPPGPVGSTGVTDEQRPGEATFVQIAAAEPSFAGFFVDGDELVVLAAPGAVGSTGAGGTGDGGGPGDQNPGGPVGPVGSTGVPPAVADSLRTLVSGVSVAPGYDVKTVSVRAAAYSFLQLSAWRNQLETTIWSSDDVTALDLDEVRNSLTVYLRTGTGETTIRAAAQQASIPRTALYFEVSGAIESAVAPDSLGGHNRPVQGAIKMRYQRADGQYPVCTIGFNAIMNGLADTVFVTNSHCTRRDFNIDPGATTYAYQYYVGSDHRIGYEFADPPPDGYTFPRRLPKRKSDSAAYRYLVPPNQRALGKITRTAIRKFGTGQKGSTIIDVSNPYFRISSEYHWPVAGVYLQTIGLASGWNYGGTTATCAGVITKGRKKVTCAYTINARTASGDSGSPVFYWPDESNNKVSIAGIRFGSPSHSKKGWYSPLGAIEQDLGNLTTIDPDL